MYIPISRFLKKCPENCIPPENVRTGDLIKVATTNHERIWIEIRKITSDRFYGTTDTILLSENLPFKSGCMVSFNPTGRIYDIFRTRKKITQT